MTVDKSIGFGDIVTWVLLVATWIVWIVRTTISARKRRFAQKAAQVMSTISLCETGELAPGLRCKIAYSVTNLGPHEASGVYVVCGQTVLNQDDPMSIPPGVTKTGSTLTSHYSGHGEVSWLDANGQHTKTCSVDISCLPTAPPGYMEALRQPKE